MKKMFLALLLLLPIGLMAQQKIGIVNTQEVMAGMPEVKVANDKMNDLAKKYDTDLNGMRDEYNKKVEAFAKEQEGLVENIRLRRQQELQDIQTRIQQSYQVMQEDLQKQQQQLLQPIQVKIQGAIKKVADAENCTYVMESAMMLYAGNAAIDLTEKVKASLGIKK
ncbi:periplasmic chaperone [Porphyromonas macacae]|uniref:Periplasmic chaperone n=2 Tax=Porphyromonas macacae TaxID=28115 RepID=A0A379DJW9_9PORP|nr:OmpH family outer membrane protein [Porphyromonas macacae]SUB78688.1 periplasmic chaperone [Porphyromonas macacae]